jgi:hypothetical protein
MESPVITTLGRDVAQLIATTLQDHPPRFAHRGRPLVCESCGACGYGDHVEDYTPHRLGDYLLAWGYLVCAELYTLVVSESWTELNGHLIQIGERAIQSGLVPREVIGTLLVLQITDRLTRLSPEQRDLPRPFVAYLLMHQRITVQQLALAFQTQLRLVLDHGAKPELTEILITQGSIDHAILEAERSAYVERIVSVNRGRSSQVAHHFQADTRPATHDGSAHS